MGVANTIGGDVAIGLIAGVVPAMGRSPNGAQPVVHMDNQVRAVFLTGFGQMDLEPHPTRGALRGT
jgi:hypothetical protein